MLQRDLVKLSAVAQPAMVATLTRLERDGLIARRSHERDRRAAVISLTKKGKSVVAAAEPVLSAVNAEALTGFNTKQQEVLARSLALLIKNLGDES